MAEKPGCRQGAVYGQRHDRGGSLSGNRANQQITEAKPVRYHVQHGDTDPAARHDPPSRRTGRWRTGQRNRERLLEAARARFTREGYDRATARAIAADAGVDVAMVYYFFGSKERLFATAVVAPQHPFQVLSDLLEDGTEDLGARLVRAFLERWEREAFEPSLALFRSVFEHQPSRTALQEALQGPAVERLAAKAGVSEPGLRVELVTAHLMGLAVARYEMTNGPLANADIDTLVAWVGPVVQRYLTGPTPEAGN
ncbi:TetR/AcrR family transcriptional regulator [Haloactinospora alba]|nr:TetR family transcriptional regulator [Haloactinospora alba]